MNPPAPNTPIPVSYTDACHTFQKALKSRKTLHRLNLPDFLNAWFALFYIAPGLHPDEYRTLGGGWPEGWKCFGKEAFRRDNLGELEDAELYPCDAQHAALAVGKNIHPCED